MELSFSKKTIKYTLLVLVLAELLSFLGYFFDILNTAVFFAILLSTLILTLIRLEYGVYIILGELFIGSTGYLFSFDYNGFSLSLRIGLFLILVAVWLAKVIKNKKFEFRSSNLFRWYWLLILFLAWGLMKGYLNKYNFSDIFFDVNAYIFLALIFVFFETIKSWQNIKIIFEIMIAGIIMLAGKAVFYYLIYASNLKFFSIDLYHWQRSTEGGQLAHLGHNLYRILFLSDIYPLMAIFIFGVIYLFIKSKKINTDKFTKKIIGWTVAFSTLIIVVSFFRSYWAALFLGLIISVFLLFKSSISRKKTLVATLALIIVLIVEIGLVFGISWGLQKFVVHEEVLLQKDIFSTDDPGIVGRLALLRPLWYKFSESPLIGHGFGTTVSFLTNDPRHFNQQYITYAFEWGYFDIAIKIGLIGLLVYLLFILMVFKNGFRILKTEDSTKKAIIAGLLLGLLALVLTHGVSPYLNHPLGIGYLMLVAVAFHVLNKEKSLTDG